VIGEANALWCDDLEKLEHSVGSRPVEFGDRLLVLLRRHGPRMKSLWSSTILFFNTASRKV
jgi:hypothetical protein